MAGYGRNLIRMARADFHRFNTQVVGRNQDRLLGVRINVCTEFTPMNAVFVLGLVEMGARVKWVSSDRHF